MSHITIAADEVERALAEACRRAHAEILGVTVAPRLFLLDDHWDGHDWLIEFADPPRAPELFPRVLDAALCRLRPAYRVARLVDGLMAPPRVIELPAGTFHAWRDRSAALGRLCIVPRSSADRAVADGLIAVAASGRVPLIAVGP